MKRWASKKGHNNWTNEWVKEDNKKAKSRIEREAFHLHQMMMARKWKISVEKWTDWSEAGVFIIDVQLNWLINVDCCASRPCFWAWCGLRLLLTPQHVSTAITSFVSTCEYCCSYWPVFFYSCQFCQVENIFLASSAVKINECTWHYSLRQWTGGSGFKHRILIGI